VKVFLAVPHYDCIVPQALPGLIQASLEGRVATLNLEGGSLLAMVFNKLWCRALEERDRVGLTHFSMHHADIEAPAGWLDVLLDEQARVGADVLSCVVPIKDNRGLTSTGTRDPETGRIRRFTLREVFDMPETFSIEDTDTPGHWLMVNTGMWVCDFTRPWVAEVCFSILDGMAWENGARVARALPEDWNFSGWCAQRGLKVWATRKVPLIHHGRAGYTSARVWGEWNTDHGDLLRTNLEPRS
jgi:hypothetical protein